MTKFVKIASLTALLALVAGSAFASNAVRISQVYGGGGGTSTTTVPTYKQDYIEIFNSSNAAVDVSNWALVYGSSTGSWNTAGGSTFTNLFVFPQGTSIAPCGYLLVAAFNTGATITGVDLNTVVTPDFQQSLPNPILNVAQGAGKVMLTTSAPGTGLACGSEGVTIVDKVAFGTGALCFEGTGPTATLTSQKGAVRNNGGLSDSDDNAADFTVVTAPVPHNGSSGYTNPNCQVVPTLRNTWGGVKSIYR